MRYALFCIALVFIYLSCGIVQAKTDEKGALEKKLVAEQRQLEATKDKIISYIQEHSLTAANALADDSLLNDSLTKDNFFTDRIIDEHLANQLKQLELEGYCKNHPHECRLIKSRLSAMYLDEYFIISQDVAETRSRLESPELYQKKWEICNNSREPRIFVAYGVKDDKGWIIKGWRRIEQGECSILVPDIDTLKSPYVYFYAKGGKARWEGKKEICADPQHKFSYRDAACKQASRHLAFLEYNLDKESSKIGLSSEN